MLCSPCIYQEQEELLARKQELSLALSSTVTDISVLEQDIDRLQTETLNIGKRVHGTVCKNITPTPNFFLRFFFFLNV